MNVIAAAVIFLGGLSVLMNSCQTKQSGVRLVAGTLDAPLPADTAPQHVQEAYGQALKVHPFDILSDEANSISVCGIGEVDTTSTEGYGIMVTKGATSTTFLNIRNTRQPMARYDAQTGNLWLTSSAMEGSGVRVEWLYQIRFHDNDSAYVAAVVNPYDVQQALCQRLGYTLDGDSVTLCDGVTLLKTLPLPLPVREWSDIPLHQKSPQGKVTTPLPDREGLGESLPEEGQGESLPGDSLLFIGEQLFYDLTGNQVQLQVVPGVKLADSPVLIYDDMPTLSLPVSSLTPDPSPKGEGSSMPIQLGRVLPQTEGQGGESAETLREAIDRYFVDSVGSHYSKGEFCIPSHTIVAVDEQNAEDIRVWGDFWVFNYNLVGDTLKCVSGGSHPGLAHVQQVDGQFQVTAFDAVEDGSRYLPTAKRIFGERFDEFQRIASDEKAREAVRAEAIAAYVEQHELPATLYQDYGWPAVKFNRIFAVTTSKTQ